MDRSVDVNINDKYRVLLTELLPYEIPLWLTNDYFYYAIKPQEGKKNNLLLDKVIKSVNKSQFFIPLSYAINKDDSGLRELSIIHPVIQIKLVDFYADYHNLILYYCQKSEKTLRAPISIVRKFIDIETKDKSAGGVEDNESERLYCSSYFRYNKYSFLYKFFESYEFHTLERKFKKFMQLDISKCFHHIYTHSISWAVKSKDYAKSNLGIKAFDTEFDSIMQK